MRRSNANQVSREKRLETIQEGLGQSQRFAQNLKVASIEKKQTHDWLLHKHYLKRLPPMSYSFGLFCDDVLNGVCTFGVPASNALCVGICGKEYKYIVLELNRLCVDGGGRANILSYFVSKCLKLLPQPKIIVSYADTSVGHNGYIYQATNFIYTGLSAKRTERYDPLNPEKHSKTVTDNKNIQYKDLAVRERARKHRYIYFIGSQKEKKDMVKKLKYKIFPYPKGKNKRYDDSYNPNVQSVLFINN
jgi:hypothetical protein